MESESCASRKPVVMRAGMIAPAAVAAGTEDRIRVRMGRMDSRLRGNDGKNAVDVVPAAFSPRESGGGSMRFRINAPRKLANSQTEHGCGRPRRRAGMHVGKVRV